MTNTTDKAFLRGTAENAKAVADDIADLLAGDDAILRPDTADADLLRAAFLLQLHRPEGTTVAAIDLAMAAEATASHLVAARGIPRADAYAERLTIMSEVHRAAAFVVFGDES